MDFILNLMMAIQTGKFIMDGSFDHSRVNVWGDFLPIFVDLRKGGISVTGKTDRFCGKGFPKGKKNEESY
jgi:hypothetical protein